MRRLPPSVTEPALASAILCAALVACGGSAGEQTSPASSAASGGGGEAFVAGAELPCAPGELPRVGGSCQAPGVPADGCGAGFLHDGDGCSAILPDAPCAAGEMAIPGDTSCHPAAACAAGKWGDIPTTASTQYVDAAYTGGGSTGAEVAPWTTIQAAVAAAKAGDLVAIAAGEYAESVLVDKPLLLWGTCPGDVHVAGSAGPALHIQQAAGAEVHHLSVSGPDVGISIDGAGAVLVDGVWVHDTASFALFAGDLGGAPEVTVHGSLFEGAGVTGVVASGSSLTVEESVVRGTRASGSGDFGRGMSFEYDFQTGRRATGLVERSVVTDNHDIGVLAFGADLEVEESVVRATQSRASDQLEGTGIAATLTAAHGERASLQVHGSVVEKDRFCGICTYDSDVGVDMTTVRDIDAQAGDGWAGFGVRVQAAGTEDVRPQVTFQRSSIVRSRQVGFVAVGADATMEAVIIRDTLPRLADDLLGRGVSVEVSDEPAGSTLILRGSRIEKSREAGVLVLGSHAEIESTLVADTLSSAHDGRYGFGIGFLADVLESQLTSSGSIRTSVVDGARMAGVAVAGADVSVENVIVQNTLPQGETTEFGDGIIGSSYLFQPKTYPTSLDVAHATVEKSARAGVASFGANVTVSSTRLECNKISLDGENVGTDEFAFHDAGGNECACGSDAAACKVLSSGLEPPLGIGK